MHRFLYKSRWSKVYLVIAGSRCLLCNCVLSLCSLSVGWSPVPAALIISGQLQLAQFSRNRGLVFYCGFLIHIHPLHERTLHVEVTGVNILYAIYALIHPHFLQILNHVKCIIVVYINQICIVCHKHK